MTSWWLFYLAIGVALFVAGLYLTRKPSGSNQGKQE